MNDKFRKVFLSLSSLYIIAGLSIIIWPDIAKKIICIAAGCTLILSGLLQLIICWKEDTLATLEGKAPVGVLLLISGVVVLTHCDTVVSMLIAILGLFLTVDGFSKLQLACTIKKLSLPAWKRDVIAALLIMAIGVFLLFDPFQGTKAMAVVTGAVLVLNGVMNLWVTHELAQLSKRVAQGLPASGK